MDESGIDTMAFVKILAEIVFMLILSLIAIKVKLVVHGFGVMLMLYHYAAEYASA